VVAAMSAAALRLRNARFRRRGNKTANQTATTKRRPRCTFVQTGGAVIGLNGAWARRQQTLVFIPTHRSIAEPT